MENHVGRANAKWISLCFLVCFGLWACNGDTFDITGEWEIIASQDGSQWGYDRSRAAVWTFTGDQNGGDISADISFLSGTYRVSGRSITFEVVSGRGPMWSRRYFQGVITGDGSMQGRYEGESIPLNTEEDAETFSGLWWAIKKR